MTSHLGTEAESFLLPRDKWNSKWGCRRRVCAENGNRNTTHVRIPKVHRQIKQYYVIHLPAIFFEMEYGVWTIWNRNMVPKVDYFGILFGVNMYDISTYCICLYLHIHIFMFRIPGPGSICPANISRFLNVKKKEPCLPIGLWRTKQLGAPHKERWMENTTGIFQRATIIHSAPLGRFRKLNIIVYIPNEWIAILNLRMFLFK